MNGFCADGTYLKEQTTLANIASNDRADFKTVNVPSLNTVTGRPIAARKQEGTNKTKISLFF